MSSRRAPSPSDIDPASNLYLRNLQGQAKTRDRSRRLITFWTTDPVPDDFVACGSHPPTPAELELAAITLGTWRKLVNQWR